VCSPWPSRPPDLGEKQRMLLRYGKVVWNDGQ
jgi:hypothetical protein